MGFNDKPDLLKAAFRNAAAPQARKPPPAPAVYRPQPLQKCLQPKMPAASQPPPAPPRPAASAFARTPVQPFTRPPAQPRPAPPNASAPQRVHAAPEPRGPQAAQPYVPRAHGHAQTPAAAHAPRAHTPPKVLQAKPAAGAFASCAGHTHAAPPSHWNPNAIQLAKKDKRRKKKKDDDDDYLPPSEMNKHRATFSKAVRRRVLRKAPRHHERGYYACPACHRPVADSRGKEIRIRYRSKNSGRVKRMTSLAMDHFPAWAPRLATLQKRGATDEEIRDAHNDVNFLRPLCWTCNHSHRYEHSELDANGDDLEEYFTDDEEAELNSGTYAPFRKGPPPPPPPPPPSTGAVSVV